MSVISELTWLRRSLAMRLINDNEEGAVLAIGLIVLTVLAFLGTAAITLTTTDVLISGNYRSMIQTLHTAEAGTEEARARLRTTAANPITDAHSAQTQWRAYLGTATKAQGRGYDSGNVMHTRWSSLVPNMGYTVEIKHAELDAGVAYWGDDNGDGVNTRNTTTGQNIYVISSNLSANGSNNTVQIEAVKLPPLTVPGAVYVESSTLIQGTSTDIIGTNGCGGPDLPGIVSTLPAIDADGNATIVQNGNPNIAGNPPIVYNGTNLDVQAMVNGLKGYANFKYTVNSETHTGSATPGPGDGWGVPTPGATTEDPSSCTDNNIVHYDTQGTYITFAGGSTGCGILLIEGDADFHGGFNWYGPILVTGSATFSGGGGKQVTGALLSGGSIDADIVGGSANIVYCSDAIKNQTQNRPLLVLKWREL